MRKIIICLIGAIILSNCEIKPKEVHAQQYATYDDGRITTKEYTFEGMRYVAFISGGKYETSVAVVNVTRDKLQCEIITENLKNLRNGKAKPDR
jgi:hypothetical protein